MKRRAPLAVFWIRRDLRLEDNHGLYRALVDHDQVLPVFIFDPTILDPLKDVADKRVNFIHQSMKQLHRQLAGLGSSLWTFYGTPEEAFLFLTKEFDLQGVYTNHDYEPAAIGRDQKIANLLKEQGIPFHSFKDQCIFEKSEVLSDKGTPYTVFTPYKKKWLATLGEEHTSPFDTAAHFKSLATFAQPFPMISITDIGFKDSGDTFPSLEPDLKTLANYDQNRDLPGLDATSHLGVHLRFGTISIRHLVVVASKVNKVWLSQLIWRDFFMQILHHFPHVVTGSFRPEYDLIPWRNRVDEFERWCKGNTGIPIVDAGMRELNATGYMHNRVRMIVASFLCKHLLIDWRWGERYFAAKLLDYDLAANNGNWQWAAGSGCDAAPYFRVFNPWVQAQKFDKNMDYVRRWVPEFLKPDYPYAMVDHQFARKRALDVYRKGLEASDPNSRDEGSLPFF